MASTPQKGAATPRCDSAGPQQTLWPCSTLAGDLGDVGSSLPGHQVPSPGTPLPTSAPQQRSAVPGFTCGCVGLNQALNII